MDEKSWLWTAVIAGAVILGFIVTKNGTISTAPRWVPSSQQQQQAQPPGQPVTGWAAYIKQAKESGKPLFVYFGGTACAPCQRMKNEVLPNTNVQTALSKYIVCIFDVSQESALAKRFGVSVVPTMLIVDGDERVQKTSTGYMTADQFVNWLGGQVAPPSQADPQRNNSPSPSQPQRRPSPNMRPGSPGQGPVGPGCPG